jgi:formamidopyrimidine-DNA glycosylase
MPELPDLLYIRDYLNHPLKDRTITGVRIKQPVILRTTLDEPFEQTLHGRRIEKVRIHGPFIHMLLSRNHHLIINLMLSGRIQHQCPGERAEGNLCCSIDLDDGTSLNICDNKLMAKVYSSSSDQLGQIPRFNEQGIDVLSDTFTADAFLSLTSQHGRMQVRVFVNDQTLLSAIGNAYADEVLFDARIHPKSLLAHLDRTQLMALYSSIKHVIRWGTEEVRKAGAPIQTRVRDHMQVRNRKGQPCRRCGTTIRREGVRGHDVFFCPRCQPPTRSHFLDWRKIDTDGHT